ncbi:MAG: hypothetical protein H6822_36345 [Planctomycetaceae bacterium]|nr:hypothetical protein [Planctomycetales bacterium]MCB9927660.1 hypothetical protein [Planctomycetaceae bacterium]
MKTKYHSAKRCNHGTITHEATIAIVLATAVILGTAQTLAFISHQRRDVDRRILASREAGNLMEQVTAKPWDQITTDTLAELALSEECATSLPEARLQVSVASAADSIGKQITLEIDWVTMPDQRVVPLRLIAWRYPTEGRQ